jgi:2-hydroxycyclohexanecarboxyl-CoA dehydrogenase
MRQPQPRESAFTASPASSEKQAPIAVITGAASGIGKATAEHFQALGWRIVGVDLSPSHLERSVRLDVTDYAAFVGIVELIESELGPVELLVTAAGFDQEVPIVEMTMPDWDRLFEVVFGGTVNACAAVMPHMVRRGRGAIVAVSSEIGLAGCPLYSHYSAAKGAVNGFVKALSLEAIEHGIRVNAVAPGPTDTPMIDETQWRDAEYAAALPLRRLVDPIEIAGTIALLADPDSYYVGEILSPNAGAVI